MQLNSKAIRVIRAATGLGQTELASLVGLSPSMISLIETGCRPLSKSVEQKMLAAFGISDDVLSSVLHDLKRIDNERFNYLKRKEDDTDV